MRGFCVAISIVVLVACIKCENSVMKRSSWKKLDESSRKVEAFNEYARKEMIKLIPGELKSLKATYSTSYKHCLYEIKKAVKECKGCLNAIRSTACVSRSKEVTQKSMQLEEYLALPFIEVAKLVEDIAGKLKGPLEDLGSESVKFLNDLGKFAENLGDDLLKGTGDAIPKIVDGLKMIGEDMVKLGEKVGKELENGVKDITKEIGNALDDLGRETENLMKGIDNVANDIGKGLEDVAKDIGKGVEYIGKNIGQGVEDAAKTIGGWFGKRDLDRMRRSCPLNCPICSKLDKRQNSNRQINDNVCGTAVNVLGDRVKKVSETLTILINILRESKFRVIKSIRYNRDSEVEEDVYKENYVTYEIKGKRHVFKSTHVLDIFDRKTTGGSIGNQIMSILRKKDFAIV